MGNRRFVALVAMDGAAVASAPWFNEESPCPRVSKLCNWLTLLCLVLAAWTHAFFEYSDRRPSISAHEDPWVTFSQKFAAVAGFTGLMFELAFAVSMEVLGMRQVCFSNPTFANRVALNRKMIFVFSVFFTVYTLIASDCQIVHQGWIADVLGGKQAVYAVRYIEWTVCAPIIFSVLGYIDPGPDGRPRSGMNTSGLLTGLYCIPAWQVLVVKNFTVSCILNFVCFAAYFVASYEQLIFAWHIRKVGRAGPMRCVLVQFIVFLIGVYGLVYLLPIVNLMSETMEQKFYCYADTTFKVFVSAVLLASRTMEDMAKNTELQARVTTHAEDLGRLIETAAVPVFGVDTECQIVTWNQKMTELTSLEKAEALGCNILSMVQGSCFSKTRTMIEEALQGNLPRPIEINMVMSSEKNVKAGKTAFKGDDQAAQDDGKKIKRVGLLDTQTDDPAVAKGFKSSTMVISASATRDKSGNVVGVTCMGYDLTEIAALREAEARKQRFLSVVSHELRSPLHGIIGLSDSLACQQQDPNLVKKLKIVKNCAMRLLDLVVNIMEMASMVSKDSADKNRKPKRLARDAVDLPKLLEELTTLIFKACDKSGRPLLKGSVELINKMSPNMPIIEADLHKCAQVFENLLTNACKFTREGSITVTSNVGPRNEYVEVSITDTGKGISEEATARIFEPFEQEEATEMREYEGIGLGLPIADEVVRRHGGQIILDTKLGVGSRFTVRLPVAMQEVVSLAAKDNNKSRNHEERKSATAPPVQDAGKAVQLAAQSQSQVVRVQSKRFGSGEGANAQMQKEKPERQPIILAVGEQDDLLGSCHGYEIHNVADVHEVAAYFAKTSRMPDVLLVDSATGSDLCEAVHAQLRSTNVPMPLLMMSPGSGPGAKPPSSGELKVRVQSLLDLKLTADSSIPGGDIASARCRSASRKPTRVNIPRIPKECQDDGQPMAAECHKHLSVLRCDVVGWTELAQSVPPSKAIQLLAELYEALDLAAAHHGAQSYETLGGSFLCAASSEDSQDHASKVAKLGMKMLATVAEVKRGSHWENDRLCQALELRVGCHTGLGVIGSMGREEFKTVLFGDAVSGATCLQENCSLGCVHISSYLFEELTAADRMALTDTGARIIEAGPLQLAGCARKPTYIVVPRGTELRTLGADMGTEVREQCKALEGELRRTQQVRDELEARMGAAQNAAEQIAAEYSELKQRAKAERSAESTREDLEVCTPQGRLPSQSVPEVRPKLAVLPIASVQKLPCAIEDDSSAQKEKRMPIILSVDDDIVNQTVIESALSDLYEIHVAMDGTEALEYFASHSRLPDVMLLDVMMPGMSGFEVCATIRNQFRLPATVLPIVMLSARSPVDKSVIAGLENGCNDYISKPFEKEVLKARVHTALQIKRLHDQELKSSQYEQLLHSIMPPHVVERLQAGENMISESHKSVTILFSDIVGWTNIAEILTTSQVVVLLNDLFSAFDNLTEEFGVFKVETIGDAYMCAAGHDGSMDHAQKIARFGLAMIEAAASVKPPQPGLRLQIRVGAHTGPAFTGVVGRKVPRYCFFGDTVNVSSRMESHGSPGCLHVSNPMFKEIMKDSTFQSTIKATIVQRGTIEIKGKGQMLTHLIVPEKTPIPVTLSKTGSRRGSTCGSPKPHHDLGGGASPTTPSYCSEDGSKSPWEELKALESQAAAQESARQRAENECRAEARACAEARQEVEKQASRFAAMESELAAGRRMAKELEDQLRSVEQRRREQAAASEKSAREQSSLSTGLVEAERAQAAGLERAKVELQEREKDLEEARAQQKLLQHQVALLQQERQQQQEQLEEANRQRLQLDARLQEEEQARMLQAEEQPRQQKAPKEQHLLQPPTLQEQPSLTVLSQLSGRRGAWSIDADSILGGVGSARSACESGIRGNMQGLERQVKHLALEVKLKERRLQACRAELAAKTAECEALRAETEAKRRDAEAYEDELEHALLDLGQ